jgi:hypothetical protein
LRKLAFIALILPALALAYSFDLDPSSVELVPSEGYVVPSVDGGCYPTEEGVPMLPTLPLFVSVPVGLGAAEVTVTDVVVQDLPGYHAVLPASTPRPVSEPAEFEAVFDGDIYGSCDPYPAVPLSAAGGGNMGGLGVAAVEFSPFIYEPAAGRLSLITHIEFDITTELLPYEVRVPTRLTRKVADLSLEWVRSVVVNPWDVYLTVPIVEPGYTDAPDPEPGLNSPDIGDTAEWVVITPEAFVESFEPLRDWKLLKGYTTAIVTTEYIFENYPDGRDNAERIRDFIIDAFENWSTKWVLLGGDCNMVKERRGYVIISGTSEDDRSIPCDLYFSDLDGTWNEDDDYWWGEWPDDNPDMYPDVYVSRYPVVGTDFVDVMVGKTMTYEKTIPTGHTTDALFLGAYLDGSTSGGTAKDRVDLLYLPPQFDPVTKLYQRLGNINRVLVIAQMNAGNCAVTNHCAHSNYSSIGTGYDSMWATDAYALVNGDELGWINSIGCMCGGFDRYQCFSEQIVLAPNGGMVASIMNSRYGWYMPGAPGFGPSDLVDQQYFCSMFSEGFTNFGYAMADMTVYFVPSAKGNPYYRWCIYENNVMGPTETVGWTNEMRDLTVQHPEHWSHGGFTVTVTVDGSPVEDALACLYKEDDCHVSGRTGPGGQVTLYPDPSEPGEMHVTVTAQDAYPYEGTTTVDDDVDVTVAEFTGAAGEDGVLLSWRLEDTRGLVGLNVYRAEDRLNGGALAPEAFGRYLDRDALGANDYYLELVAGDGSVSRYGPITVTALGEVSVLTLSAAYPNPSAGAVSFEVTLPETGAVELAIFDIAGRRVATAASGELAGGRHTVAWDATDAPAGVYIARLVTDGGTLTTRLVVAR